MLYPLRFEPIFKGNLWGGTRLRSLLNRPASDEPTGEAWLLSDVDGSPSRVAGGPLANRTLRELMAEYGSDLLGDAKPINGRFPLLIKLIDARQELSVQVHPSDEQARAKDPTAAGKTEAWVILAANPATSRVYSGFQPGMTAERFCALLQDGTSAATLHQFTPKRGDCLFLRAGTVHAIGADLLVYEVQQTSDITYRLFDWNRVDAKTGLPRQLHVEDGLAVSNFESGPCPPVNPDRDGERERLAHCEYFTLERLSLKRPFEISGNHCRIMTVIEGRGSLDGESLQVGDTYLIPACISEASLIPQGSLTVLYAAPGESAMIVDLNADLGEGAGTDAELLKLISSANVNCGFHAADAETVRATLELAAAAGVAVGAHPGYPDREHFGRREMTLTSKQVATQVFHQVGVLAGLVRVCRTELRYLKPHGALYNQACRDLDYARPVVAAAFVNGLAVVGLPDSMLTQACSKLALPFIAEGFVDRRYQADGTLVPRTEANAMIHDPKEAVEQAAWLVKEKKVRTLCLHGDSPGAVEFAAAVRQSLLDQGYKLKAFA